MSIDDGMGDEDVRLPRGLGGEKGPTPTGSVRGAYRRNMMGGGDPGDDMVLPRGAPVIHDMTEGTNKVHPGNLPIYMATEGLVLLRKGDYKAAASYYQEQLRSSPELAEGWFGAGAAMAAVGDSKKCVTLFLKGIEIDGTFPLGALLAEAKPGEPKMIMSVVDQFVHVNTPQSLHSAILTLDEITGSPTTPKKLYVQAHDLKRKCRERIDTFKIQGNSSLLAIKHQAEATRKAQTAAKFVIRLTIVAVLAVGGWFAYRYINTQLLLRSAQEDYVQATTEEVSEKKELRINTAVPNRLYLKSWDEYRAVARLNPDNFTAQFMLAKIANAMFERVRQHKASDLSRAQLSEMVQVSDKAKDNIKRLDPRGDLTKAHESNLEDALKPKPM